MENEKNIFGIRQNPSNKIQENSNFLVFDVIRVLQEKWELKMMKSNDQQQMLDIFWY